MMVVEDIVALIDALADETVEGIPQAMAYLMEDLTGQVSEALSRPDWYLRWGVHYLPSLMFAHLSQQCNNFKDAGVQFYGGRLFKQLREAADRIFIELPPPTPTAVPPTPSVVSGPPQGA